jgi:hypothetical protein
MEQNQFAPAMSHNNAMPKHAKARFRQVIYYVLDRLLGRVRDIFNDDKLLRENLGVYVLMHNGLQLLLEP